MDAKCVEAGLSEASCGAISPGLYLGYMLLGLSLLAAIVLPLMNALKNPNVLVKSGISFGILVVLFVISYGIADTTVSPIAKGLGQDEGGVKLIGAGLIMLYITFFIAVAGLVYSEINKALK